MTDVNHAHVPEEMREAVAELYDKMHRQFADYAYGFLRSRPMSPTETMAIMSVAIEIIVGGWVTLSDGIDKKDALAMQMTVQQLRAHVVQLLTQATKVVLANDPRKMAEQMGQFAIEPADGEAPPA